MTSRQQVAVSGPGGVAGIKQASTWQQESKPRPLPGPLTRLGCRSAHFQPHSPKTQSSCHLHLSQLLSPPHQTHTWQLLTNCHLLPAAWSLLSPSQKENLEGWVFTPLHVHTRTDSTQLLSTASPPWDLAGHRVGGPEQPRTFFPTCLSPGPHLPGDRQEKDPAQGLWHQVGQRGQTPWERSRIAMGRRKVVRKRHQCGASQGYQRVTVKDKCKASCQEEFLNLKHYVCSEDADSQPLGTWE